MKKFKAGFIALLFLTFCCLFIRPSFAVTEEVPQNENACPNEALPVSNNPSIKVGISDTNFVNYHHKFMELSSAGGLSVRDKSSLRELVKVNSNAILGVSIDNNNLKIQVYSAGSKDKKDVFLDATVKGIVVIPQDGFTKVHSVKRLNSEAVYRGVMEITLDENAQTFVLVNVLGVENYLRGVVPNEMPVSFGSEALKAQAIAARNYVLKPRLKYYKEYDICDSVACQVYFGAGTENPVSDMAVAQTEGNFATYDGDLILAQYSSTAGGYTENYENAFNSQKDKCIGCKDNAIPYLKGVPDVKTTPKLDNEKNAQDFYMNKQESFDSSSPYYRWEREWTREELEKVLSANINSRSFVGFVERENNNEPEFGSIKNIEVVRRGVSGKVVEMKITTDKNVFTVQKELVIRQLFKKDGKNLPSANIVFEFVTSDGNVNKKCLGTAVCDENSEDFQITSIKVYGGGLGHGVGMSQFGAGRMHSLGYKYDEILQHYYTGIAITTQKTTLSDKSGQLSSVQSFYTEEPKGYLYVQNYSAPSKLVVDLNGNVFELPFGKHSKDKIFTNVSEYINVGKNHVKYTLLGDKNASKKMKVYIELKGAVNER